MALLEDKKGRIWIGTALGVNIWYPDENGSNFTRYTVTEGLSNNLVQSMLEDRTGRIWIGTHGGVSIWNPDDGEYFTHYTQDSGLRSDKIQCLEEDKYGRIWMGTLDAGIIIWNSTENGRFIHYTKVEGLTSNRIHSLVKDQDDRIWMGTGGGISIWDPSQEAYFLHYTEEDGIRGTEMKSLLKDRNGRIWMGSSDGGGVNIWGWNYFNHQNIAKHLGRQTIRGLLEDRDGRIWIGANERLSIWDTVGGGRITYYPQVEDLGKHPIMNLTEDKTGRIWIATKNGDIYVWDEKGFIHYSFVKPNDFLNFTEDNKGRIWINNFWELIVWDPSQPEIFSNYTDFIGLNNLRAWALLTDQNGDIWISTVHGTYVWNHDSNSLLRFSAKEGLNHDYSFPLMEDKEGRIWIGTKAGVGVWDGNGFIHYIQKEALSQNYGRSFLQDSNNNIWFGTYNGLNLLKQTADDREWDIQQFFKADGLTGLSIFEMEEDSRGQLWLGTTGGINRLDLNQMKKDTTPPVLILRDIQPIYEFIDWREVQNRRQNNNDSAIYITSSSSDNLSINDLGQVEFDSVKAYTNLPADPVFPYKLNNLTLHWSGVHGTSSHKVQYSYFLEGNDQNWSPLLKETDATFQNLSSGNYTFKVKALGGNGQWSETISYSFKVRPPWWASTWAYFCYIIAGIVVIWSFIEWRIREQRKKLDEANLLNERLQQIDKLKDQFLANTSHELRTPLNGIIGISESLYDQAESISPDTLRENLSMTISSGKRLSSLVNDILDFSKLKEHEIELRLKPVDIRALVDLVLRIHQPLIEGKDLKLVNEIPADLPLVLADEDRVQQILFNLIGNAVKFTEKGQITIGIQSSQELETQNSKLATIFVQDTGIGIPAEKQSTIFQEFHQADGSISREFAGTGLGLSISKKLVELHGGEMWVESEERNGSTFFFTLPFASKGDRVLASAIVTPLSRVAAAPGKDFLNLEDLGNLSPRADAVHILVVDDEPINQQVIKNHLSHEHFHLTQAMNGEEALKLLNKDHNFDLVILDIMMPRMSGYEVCQKIREQYLPSELPVIMVTAKNQVADLVQGLNTGANDYVAKPFSKDEFLARVKTHLNLHQINRVTNRFVPTAFLKALGKSTLTEVRLGDQKEENVTVFFSDIRGYTTLAETMTPEENFRFVNAYAGRMGPIIQQNDGFVNQYLGDGIMAIFQRNPLDGLKAAIEMQSKIRSYNEERKETGRIPLRVGMGFHTGKLIMGIIGDAHRTDAATISDTVNTAARMESLTKEFGANILLSEQVAESIKSSGGSKPSDDSQIHFRYLGRVRVKGRKAPIGVYECLNSEPEEDLNTKLGYQDQFEEAIDHYTQQRFSKAIVILEEIIERNPSDFVVQYFLKKAKLYLMQDVPEDWVNG